MKKYQLGSSNKIFIRENLSRVNDDSSFEVIKLKRRGVIHGCFTRDGMAHIKLDEHGEHGKGIKVLHKSHFS